jgi:sugar lactone lactonase YvrE
MAADQAIWTASPSDDTITRFDPQAGDFSQIRVGGTTDALASSGDAMWAALGENGTVVRYDIATERVMRIDVGGRPTQLAFDDGSIWVTVVRPLVADQQPSTSPPSSG